MPYALIVICLLAAVKASFEPTKQVLSQFRELEYRYTGGRYDNRLFQYRLHTPREIDRTQHYPLLLWLHGGRERGDDNRAQLRWLDAVLEEMSPDEVNYFILAVQVPSNVDYWTAGNPADDMLTVAKAILDHTISNLPIDINRVYLAGVSSGGSGCWEMATRYPDTFAAIAPMGSIGGNLARLDRIKNVPIWAFHSQADHPEFVQRTVDVLKNLGGTVYLTVIPSDPDDLSDWLHKHDCWRAAIRQYEVVQWLFKQHLGSPVVPPPNFERKWGPTAYLFAATVILGGSGAIWWIATKN